MIYKEEVLKSKDYKQNYIDGIEKLIIKRQNDLSEKRKKYASEILSDTERYRQDFIHLLGWPLTEYKENIIPTVKKTKLSDENGYSVYRTEAEVLPGVVLTGLLYKMRCKEKRPLVIVQHGGEGTPELISGFYGSTHNYHDMLERTVKSGVHVFAPQLLLWNKNYEVEYNREVTDAKLKMIGSSITAVEIYGLRCIMNYFESRDYVRNFGMVGLSYGGFYTLFTSAVDKRIKAAVSCAFFNSRERYFTSDWTWFGLSEKFDDAEIACLTFPRKLFIEVADKDPLFDHRFAVKSFDRIKEICKDKTDWIKFSVFDGSHEFDKNETFVKEMIQELENE
ncbi:MAG: dienelactone hydrolase family protein [Clostridia bacterium]|nr:dienelactone hydrolase family protein [Clostridia bacterium]